MIKGKINSFQSLGAVDGPGIRYVVFLQGCSLRCAYCHNPETWDRHSENEFTPKEVFEKVMRYKPYFKQNGGLTLSGGETLLQAEFATELFKLCRAEGINTALDTSGIGNYNEEKELLRYTDLVICDIKFATDEIYKKFSGGSLLTVLKFLDLTMQMNVPLWIRHVVVPNLTDSESEVKSIIKLATQFSNLKKIELLPFKKLCQTKYDDMGIVFPLKDTEECEQSVIDSLSLLIPKQLR